MFKYTVKRFISCLLVIIAVSFLSFIVLNLAPGDTAVTILTHTFIGFDDQIYDTDVEMVSEMYGLKDPLTVQYWRWFVQAIRGNWGISYVHNVPIWQLILSKIPYTLMLGLLAFFTAFLIAVPLGILVAVYRNKMADHIARLVTIFFGSIPGFWLAIVLMLIFSVKLRLLPMTGVDSPKNIVLPCATLMAGMLPTTFRITRSSMNEVLLQDYMTTAKTKGMSRVRQIWIHAMKNAMNPVITMAGLEIGHILGGSVIIETVFVWPGIGKLLYDSIVAHDLPMMQGCIVTIASGYVISMFLVDIVNGAIDPRMRLGGGRN